MTTSVSQRLKILCTKFEIWILRSLHTALLTQLYTRVVI